MQTTYTGLKNQAKVRNLSSESIFTSEGVVTPGQSTVWEGGRRARKWRGGSETMIGRTLGHLLPRNFHVQDLLIRRC